MASARNEKDFTMQRVKKTLLPKLKELNGRMEQEKGQKLHRYEVMEILVDERLNKKKA